MTHDSARGSMVEWKESGLWNHPGLGLDSDSPTQLGNLDQLPHFSKSLFPCL